MPPGEGATDEARPLDPAPGNRDGAEAVAERVRERFERASIARAVGQLGARLRVSVGAATYPGLSDSVEELVRNADAALYKAKRAGKNRVETYG